MARSAPFRTNGLCRPRKVVLGKTEGKKDMMKGFEDAVDEAVCAFLLSGAGDRPCVLLEEAPLRSDGGLCIDYLRLDQEGGLTGLVVVRPGEGPHRMEEVRWTAMSWFHFLNEMWYAVPEEDAEGFEPPVEAAGVLSVLEDGGTRVVSHPQALFPEQPPYGLMYWLASRL